MLTHPDAEELAYYADASFEYPNRAEIEAHLARCKSCFATVVEARNLRDMEAEGLFRSLEFRPGPKLLAYLRSPKKPQKTENPAGVLGVLAGLFTAGLASGTSDPAFASLGHSAEEDVSTKNTHDHVRNTPDDSSLIWNGPQPDIEPEHREMTPAVHISKPDPVIGTPESDSHHFPGQQSYPDTCAIRCQESIVRQYTGVHLPESYYVNEAKAHHWYHEGGGTNARDVGNLLELHNIPVHRYTEANVLNLTAELAMGHKVIIGVDSDDLWRTHPLLTDLRHVLGLGHADHAVVVTGIDTNDPEHYKVIVSDPGTGEVAARYPMEQFVTAWKESHFFMVATQDPPPESMHLPEMRHFDYRLGHIDHVGAMPYDEFRHLLQNDEHHPVSGADFHDRVEHFTSSLLADSHEGHHSEIADVKAIEHGDAHSGLEADPFHSDSTHDPAVSGHYEDQSDGLHHDAGQYVDHAHPDVHHWPSESHHDSFGHNDADEAGGDHGDGSDDRGE